MSFSWISVHYKPLNSGFRVFGMDLSMKHKLFYVIISRKWY